MALLILSNNCEDAWVHTPRKFLGKYYDDDILYEAGIPEDDIRDICPWKTGIEIDEKDNAVIMIGYQKRDYI